MKAIKNKCLILALILISSFVISLVAIPNANAHSPVWTITSYAYINAAPNPVGKGQTVDIVMWVDAPLPGAAITNDVRRHDYTLTITKPDQTVETKHWDTVSDTTSIQFYQYVPDQTGNYTLKFDYAGQNYTWTGDYQNDVIKAANTSTTLTVQEEPLPAAIDSYPLPTEYWTRPIEGQNTYWYAISSNWLGAPYITGANTYTGVPGAFQPDGSAPNSAHVMWTKPIQYGGVVGGNNTAVQGEAYYQGGSYNSRYSNGLIMQGTLFYQEPWGNAGTGGDYIAVDLRTGAELWRINPAATGTMLAPSFGYIYSYEDPNQHGALPNGLLIAPYRVGAITCWAAYEPSTGKLTTMNITNIPSGVAAKGPSGEYLIYTLTNYGNAANPNYYLAQWNSSRVFGGMQGTGVGNWYSGTVNASLPSAYDWNISLSTLKGSGWTTASGALRSAIPLVDVGNLILLQQGSFGGHPGDMNAVVTTDPANITAVSLKSATLGQTLWSNSYDPAPGNNTRTIAGWDPKNGIFVFEDTESMSHSGYSLSDGKALWGPIVAPDDSTNDWNALSLCDDVFAYGKFYYYGYSGILYAYDVKTGDLLWTYGNGGSGNSTLSGFETPYGRYPIFISAIADGKIYLITSEHSPNSPIFKGSLIRAVNATNGAELWTLPDFGNMMYGGTSPIADGYLTYLNTYDCQIYAIGKGPSALTVDAPKTAIELGKSIVISGTVTDIAAGTKQNEQAARFPNGVPAVSDASMSEWMQYVYMQKPRPTNVTGVSVIISVVDANQNYRQIGSTTSNDGYFSFNWKPDIEGQYTVYASFAGSESYYPSHAVTSFAVDPAAPTPTPTQQPTASAADLYFIPAMVGLFVFIAIVGVAIILIVRKRP